MKKVATMKSMLFLTAALVFSNAASADCTAKVCAAVLVESITVTKAGVHYIATSGDEKKMNCTPESGIYATLTKTENASQILASLLAAQMAGRKVDIRTTEGSAGCAIEYITTINQ